MAERVASRPPPSRDVAGEDFLFHLYRGSELLQDNRVHDAKAELEQALSLQPSDPKGQDLLGIVYFRLGLYPRAIAIYEQLIKQHPDAIEPRINLALSYLKTGQPAQARFELEKVVEQSPGHSRAWGYLGLAFQRLGDYERASYAFQAGGHDGMARRLIEMTATGGALSVRPEPPAREAEREPSFAPEGNGAGEARVPESIGGSGTWPGMPGLDPAAIQRARSAPPPPPPILPSIPPVAAFAPPPVPRSASSMGLRPAEPGSAPYPGRTDLPAPSAPPPASLRMRMTPPRRPGEVAREALLVFPRDAAVSLHPSGVVLVQAAAGFSMRLDAVRAITSTPDAPSAVQKRRLRGRALDEPLGGAASPLVEIGGRLELVLGPAMGHALLPIALDEDPLYLREDALTGFDPGVGFENGRLPVGDGDALPMVQLRGPGTAIASLPERTSSIEVAPGHRTAVRAVGVLGWLGRLMPRALVASEAPGGARGLVAFEGEGMVLLDGR
jgi:uncharacterized protein (AIM24 family)